MVFSRREQAGDGLDEAAAQRIAEMEEAISARRELLFGLALFFEGLKRLYAGQEAVLNHHRERLVNIIMNDSAALDVAEDVLKRVKADPTRVEELEEIELPTSWKGYTNPRDLEERATALATAYDSVFGERPRDRDLTDEEAMQLIEAAADAFDS